MKPVLLVRARAAAACWPAAGAGPGPAGLTSTPAGGGGTQYSLSMQTLLLLTSLSFLPAMVLMMTSFTRIIIVMSLLRHALGTQTSPPNQVMVGLSLFLTFFIMSPVADKVYTEAWQPCRRTASPSTKPSTGPPCRSRPSCSSRSASPTSTSSPSSPRPPGRQGRRPADARVIPAFVTSELKTAFQIGFIVFIPS
jgi:flagellar biosynthetic protein FliP